GTPQINRCGIEDRVLRFVWCSCWTRITGTDVLRCQRESHKADERFCHKDLELGLGFSMNHVQKRLLGSARVPRAGFGVPPKQSFGLVNALWYTRQSREVRDGEDAIAGTRDACATQCLGIRTKTTT